MTKITSLLIISSLFAGSVYSQGYKVGDIASDFKLINTDGNYVSLIDYPNAKGFVVIFTCNHCPFAQAYQDRIIAIDKKYKPLGYPVIAINPNDPKLVPDDSYENMITRAKEKSYTFPYLFDNTQEVYRTYGAMKTPHVYLLQKEDSKLVVRYIGAIDDNYQDPLKVTQPYLTNAIDALLAKRTPDPSVTKAIGCSIKDTQTQQQIQK
jgi:peroxiredoxin